MRRESAPLRSRRPGRTREGLAIDLPIVDTAPVADAERHDLDGGQVVVDGYVLVVRMHHRRRAGSEDHGRRICVAVQEASVGGALAAADLGVAAGNLLGG